MSFLGSEKKVVLATRNKGKGAQIEAALQPYGIELVYAENTHVPDPEETGKTFLENALIKAKAYSSSLNLPALSDDSGLSVPALDGAPGIYSGRFADQRGGYDKAFKALEEMLNGKSHEAYFTASIVLMRPDGQFISSEAQTWGEIVFPARSGIGFGYYPVFKPHGDERTFSQMTPQEHLAYSHRHKAMQVLLKQWFDA